MQRPHLNSIGRFKAEVKLKKNKIKLFYLCANPIQMLWYSFRRSSASCTYCLGENRMINKFLPALEKFQETEQQYIEYFSAKGEKDPLGRVISNMKGTAEIQASQGVDSWLGYGIYLPAIERIFALHQGETEAEFYARTQYPPDVVNAYSIPDHAIATLIAADKYSRIHQQTVPVNTALWPLNDDGLCINLQDFPQRMQAKL